MASAFLLLVAKECRADSGLPIIALQIPFLMVLFIPIVFIEFRVLKMRRPEVTSTTIPIITANAVSTLIGYPIGWMILFLFQVASGSTGIYDLSTLDGLSRTLLLQSAWVVPHHGQSGWLIPSAGLIGLIPSFFISLILEMKVLNKLLMPRARLTLRDVAIANLSSYALLVMTLLCILIFRLGRGP